MTLFKDCYQVQRKELIKAVNLLVDAFSENSVWNEVLSNKDNNTILTEVMVRF